MRLVGVAAVAAIAVAVWYGRDWIGERIRGAEQDGSAERSHPAGGPGGGSADPADDELNDLSGQRVEISLLTMAPAEQYLAPLASQATGYREAVERASSVAVFDPHLSRAALELAAQAAALGAVIPDGALHFVLHAAGAPEPTVFHFLVRTNGDEPSEIDDAVRAALARRSLTRDSRVGVGEAEAQGRRLGRHIVVLVSQRPYRLDTVSRRAELDAAWPLRFAAPGWSKLSASVLYPDARVETVAVRELGDRFAVDVPTGAVPGTVAVSLDGVGPDGPGKLGQLTVEVARPLPSSIEVLVPPAEDDLQDLPAAEHYALELLNIDRERHGLSALERDPELDAVARAHSEDMRDGGYFAHLSPRTGLPVDRLRAAGYHASASGENIALNDSVAEAEASLMASVGHRKNILAPRYDRVGIGLARRGDADSAEWWLTQVFARKVDRVDAADAREQILTWLNDKRSADGVPGLDHDAALAAVAQRNAARATAGELDGLPEAIGEQARPYARGGAMVSVQSFHHLTDFVVPKGIGARRMELAGVGVAQDDDGGRIGVVVIVASDG